MAYKYKVISKRTGNVLRYSNKKDLAENFAKRRNKTRRKVSKSTGRKYYPVIVKINKK
ncbi:MAG: hypothetical protein PHS54_01255 [Clostridia bacterium]|nr:hypothetical protein [Clostridia bacterium]